MLTISEIRSLKQRIPHLKVESKSSTLPKIMTSIRATFLLLATLQFTSGFLPQYTPFLTKKHSTNSLQLASAQSSIDDKDTQEQEAQQHSSVRAPLKYLGPYPCIGLTFPNLATALQRSKSLTGISLDFVLDTAANTNTINGQVATELRLPVVGDALPGLGAGGAIHGGSTYMLGDCELEGIPKESQFTFMQELTASALPVANPAAAGLLSLAFFYCFEGGVEFQWQGKDGAPPSVTFYGEKNDDHLQEFSTRVKVKELPVTRLPSVQIKVNGVEMPALLDTGSPITVLNAQAAEQAGVQNVNIPGKTDTDKKGGNPLTNLANKFKEAPAAAQAAARGDVLTIAGTTGDRVDLLKSQSEADIDIVGADNANVDFGNKYVYVGNLPGLAALNALGDEAPPAVVLGMDVLRSRPMLFRARDNEAYF